MRRRHIATAAVMSDDEVDGGDLRAVCLVRAIVCDG